MASVEPDDAVFAALADGTRRAILRAVSERGPVTATALAADLPVSRQAVAKHLTLLREAGLVTSDRSGRETRFTAQPEPLRDLAEWATATGRRWDTRLDRLRTLTSRADRADSATRDRANLTAPILTKQEHPDGDAVGT